MYEINELSILNLRNKTGFLNSLLILNNLEIIQKQAKRNNR
jgi:hypothetical protein